MMTMELTDREVQIIRDALANLRHFRHGQLTLEIESEVCALQNRLRALPVSAVTGK